MVVYQLIPFQSCTWCSGNLLREPQDFSEFSNFYLAGRTFEHFLVGQPQPVLRKLCPWNKSGNYEAFRTRRAPIRGCDD